MKDLYVLFVSGLIFCLVGWFSLTTVQAQDQIKLNSGKIIIGKVIEVNPTSIKYKKEEKGTSQKLQAIPRSKVKSILFENGTEEIITLKTYELGQLVEDRPSFFRQPPLPYKNAIKFELFSPVFNHLAFSYERSLKEKLGIELEVGVVGIGITPFRGEIENEYNSGQNEPAYYWYYAYRERDKGGFVRIGPKFNFVEKYSLRGAYFKPEAVFTIMEIKGRTINERFGGGGINSFSDVKYSYRGMTAGVIGHIGFQQIFSKKWVLDMNAGIGYVGNWDFLDINLEPVREVLSSLPREIRPREGYIRNDYRYGHMMTQNVAFHAGFSIGRLF